MKYVYVIIIILIFNIIYRLKIVKLDLSFYNYLWSRLDKFSLISQLVKWNFTFFDLFIK